MLLHALAKNWWLLLIGTIPQHGIERV